MTELIMTELIAISVTALLLVVAFLSWRTSVNAVRAAAFEVRYQVYADAEKFLKAWMTHGTPDISELPVLVDAWKRSQFLFNRQVTSHLRMIWTDAVDAAQAREIQKGEAPGNHQQAVRTANELLLKHSDTDKLCAVFSDRLKISV